MKNLVSFLAGACALPFVSIAASLTFDADPATAGVQDGGGIWTNGAPTTNWWNGVKNTNWNNATPDHASFGAAIAAAGTVSVAGTVTVAGLTFNPAASGTYILTNGTITLAGGAVFTNNASATVRSLLGGSGFTKEGPFTLTLNPVGANTYTGPVTVNAGVLVVQGSAGDGTIRGDVTINTGGVLRTGTGDRIINTALITVNPGGILDLQQVDAIGFVAGEGLMTNTTTTTRTLTIDLATGVTNMFGGVIGGPVGLSLRGNNGTGGMVLTNANTFTGDNTITRGSLRITHSSALGSTAGITTIAGGTNAGRLELEGNITVGERLTLTARTGGATPNLSPHVVNVGGTNYLSGVFSNAAGGTIWNLRSDAGLLVVSGAFSTDATAARTLRVGGAGDVEFRPAFTNSGNTFDLTKTGSGRVLLVTNNTYNGTTTVEGGVLALGSDATISGSSGIVLSNAAVFDVSAVPGGFVLGAGRTISGFGVVTGDVTAGVAARINPGFAGVAGVLTFTNKLSLSPNVTSQFDFASSPLAGNDLLRVGGNFAADGEARITPLGLLDTSSPYRLVDYSGTLAGNFATAVVVNASYSATVDTNTSGQVNVSFVSTARSLVWAGGPSNWDVAVSAAWNTNADVFLTGDHVLFDDSAPSNQTVVLSGTVIPMSVTVVGSSNYLLTGGGKISGGGPITKDGAGVLTIATTNDFSGEFVISNGVLIAGANAALGATSGATTVKSGAALDVNGRNLGGELVRVEGTGGGAGAIRNSGADQQNALRRLELTGDTTVDATGRWEVRGDGGLANGLVSGLFTLTKTGTNVFAFSDTTANVGDIVIQAGQFSYANSTLLNTGFAFTVNNGGGLRLYQTANAFPRDITYTGGGNIQLVSGAQTCTVAGAVSIGGALTNDLNGGRLVLNGALSGTGPVVNANNSGTLVLNGSNTFTGGVEHRIGVLLAGNDAALGPDALTMYAGTFASPDATARTIANAVLVHSNIALGQTSGGTGALTLGGGIELNGTTRTFTVNAPVTVNGAISNGGLTKAGTETLRLMAANAYELGTTIDAGTIMLGSNATLGAGALLMSGGRIASDDGTARTITNDIAIDAASQFGSTTTTGALFFAGPLHFTATSRDLDFDSDVTWAGSQTNGGLNEKRGAGTLRITASADWRNGAALEIRDGTVIVDGGAVTNADAFRVMSTNAAGVSRIVVTNGGLITTTNIGSNLRLGYSPGGNTTATNIADISGTMRLPSGGSGGLVMLGASSARAILNLLGGGVIEARGIEHSGNASEVHFDGGTLRFLGNSNGVMNGMTLVDIRAGGLTVDTAGFVISSGVSIQDGGGGITKTGAGTFRLGGSNSYEGANIVVTGILMAVNSWALGTTNGNTVVQSGGTLSLTNNITIFEPVTAAGEGNAAGYGAIRNEGATNALDALVTLTAQTRITIASRELQIRGGITGVGNLVLSPALTNSIVIITNAPLTLATNAILFSHSPGQTRLQTGGNTFRELRVQYSNSFLIGLSDAVPTNADLMIGANAVGNAPNGFFDLNGWNQTVGVLTNANGTNVGVRIIRNSAAGTVSTLTIGSGNASSSFDGSLSDAAGVVALTKIGTGTQILFGTHTYNGITAHNAGGLFVNGTLNGTGDVLVANGATLGGTGSIAGAVANAGIVAPGNSAGLLFAGSYSQAPTGTFRVELDAANSDQLVSSGPAVLAGALEATFINSYTGVVGDTFSILIAGGGLTGTFATTNLPPPGDGKAWTISYTANSVDLSLTSATPPPATGYAAFSNLYALTLGETGDDDLDGFANLYEYVTGSNPTNSGSKNALSAARTNGLFALKFLRDTNTTDATLIIEGSYASTNDAEWIGFATNINGNWGSATNVIEDLGTPANVTAHDIVPFATNRFLRLRITRP